MTKKRTTYQVQLRVGATWETQSEWSSKSRAVEEVAACSAIGEEARVVEAPAEAILDALRKAGCKDV